MTSNASHDNPHTEARFAFKSKRLEVEFEGRDDFLTAQIEHMKPALERELKRLEEEAAGRPEVTAAASPAVTSAPRSAPAPVAPSAPDTGAADAATGAPSLEEFYRRARSREGRGSLQEMVLIFAYFLREYRGKEELGIENLNACFSLVGVTPPKSLANTMGIMKRTQKYFHSGTRRGQYALSDKGGAYVKKLIGT